MNTNKRMNSFYRVAKAHFNYCQKTIYCLLGMLLCTSNIYSQDILIKKNGDEVEVRVISISNDEIEYKKWSNQDGPSYIIPKGEVFMIKYKNGEKDVFNTKNSASTSNQQTLNADNQRLKAHPSHDNASLIMQYNTIKHEFVDFKKKDKKARVYIGTIGVLESSVLSTDEIQISFSQEQKSYFQNPYSYRGEILKSVDCTTPQFFTGKFVIEITNKTTQTVYIDKANTFRIENDGSYQMYYNMQQTTVNQGGGLGGSLNLGAVTGALGVGGIANTLAGGVNVGGGSQSSASTTYLDQRVVAIPPHGRIVLSKDEDIPIKEAGTFTSSKFKIKSFAEDFHNVKNVLLNRGEYKTYQEQNSPIRKNYILAYSLNSEFKSFKIIEFGVYLKDAIGLYYGEYDYDSLIKKHIRNNDLQTIIVEFDGNPVD